MSKIEPLLQDGVNPKWIPKRKSDTSKSLTAGNVVHPAEDVLYARKNVSDDKSETLPNEPVEKTNRDKRFLQRGFSADEQKRRNVNRSLGRRASTCYFINYTENSHKDDAPASENVDFPSTEEVKAEAIQSEVGGEGIGVGLKRLSFVSRIFVQDSDDMEMETIIDGGSNSADDNSIAESECSLSSELHHFTLHQVSKIIDKILLALLL